MPPPKAVKQILNPNTCWAAALESWLASARGEKTIDQTYLYQFFSDIGFCNEAGLRPNCLPRVLQNMMVRMQCEKVNKADLTRGYLDEKIRQSYVYMAMSKSGVGHAVVVYAAYIDPNGKDTIGIMDPFYGKNLIGPLAPFLDQRSDGDIYIGWVDYSHEIDGKAWWED